MAVLNININTGEKSITDFNEFMSTEKHHACDLIAVLLSKIQHGDCQPTIIITSRDTNPTVTTSGSGSQQITINP